MRMETRPWYPVTHADDGVPATNTDADVLATAASWRAGGRDVALATVVGTWGSSPRAAGSHMAVAGDGAFVGSVSGGCVEAAVVEAALEVIRTGECRSLSFGVNDETAWEVGLACGGQVAIHVDPVRDALLPELLRALERKRAAVVATRLDGGEQELLFPLEADAEARSGAWPVDAARRALLDDLPATVSDASGEVFLRPYNPPVRLVVVGAVHIAAPLARMAATTGLEVHLVDPRTAFATDERFPGLHLVRAWPRKALEELRPDHRTAVVTLTHDAKLDDPALVAALATPAFYIGALGSRRTHAKRLARLREQGVAEDAVARIRAPVGLDIGARTPAEIALSILAELVGELRRATAS